MKNQKHIVACAVLGTFLFALSGCSHSPNSELVNEIHFSLDGISDVTISYDEEQVTFLESETDELIIKEYMTEDKDNYHAKVIQNSDSIKISEGGKPFFQGDFSRSIKVYLPIDYHDNLTVTTTDGDIDFTGVDLSLEALHIDSTAGTVRIDDVTAVTIYLSSTRGTLKLGNVEADQIKLITTSGNVTCDKLDGTVTYTSTSGTADIKSAVGSGNYKVNNSGTLNVVYTEVTGSLSFFNKNDNICVKLPKDLEFDFIATTKNGSISTSFQEDIAIDGQMTKGTVGNHPTVTVEVETKNGNIEVIQ